MKFSLDGEAASFVHTTLKIGNVEYTVKTYSYGDSIERGDVDGNSRIVLAQTAGIYKTDDSSLDMFADDFALLMDTVKATFYEASFTITNAYQKHGDSKLTIDTLLGCRFTKRGASDSSGSDPLMRNIGFKPRVIQWNGHNPFSQMPTGLK